MYTDACFRLSDPRPRDACSVCEPGSRGERRRGPPDGVDVSPGDRDPRDNISPNNREVDGNGSPDRSGESHRASLPAEWARHERGPHAHKPDRDVERCYCSEYFHHKNDGISDSRRDRPPAARDTSPAAREVEETPPDPAAAAAAAAATAAATAAAAAAAAPAVAVEPRRRRRHHSAKHKKRESVSEVEDRDHVEDGNEEVAAHDSNSDREPAGYSFDLRVFGSYGSSEDVAQKRTKRVKLRKKRQRPATPAEPSPGRAARAPEPETDSSMHLYQPAPHLTWLHSTPPETDSAVPMFMFTMDVSQIPLPPSPSPSPPGPPAPGVQSPSTDSDYYNPEEFTPEASFDTDCPLEDCPSPVNSDCASPRCEDAALDPARPLLRFETDASDDNFENYASENSASEESPNDDEIILQDSSEGSPMDPPEDSSSISDDILKKDSHDALKVPSLIDPVDKISPISNDFPKDSSKMEDNLTPQDILKSSTDTFEAVPLDTSPKNFEVIPKDWLNHAPRNEVLENQLSPGNSPFRGFNPLPALPYHLNSNLSLSVQHLAKSRRLSPRWLPVVTLTRVDQVSKKYVEHEHRYYVKNRKGTYKLRKKFRL